MKKIFLVAALAALVGCAQQETKQSAAAAGGSEAAYQAALASAKTEQKKAAAVGGEWRDTGKLIKDAEEAATAGDFTKAESLAKKAANQGKLGQAQAASQVNVGNPAYLY